MNRLKQWMDMYGKYSIEKKLIIPLLAMVVFVFVFLAGFQYWATKSEAEKAINDKLVASSRLASLVFSNPLWNYNYAGMTDIANAMMLDPEIARVSVRTLSGSEVFSKEASGEQYVPRFTSRMEIPVNYQGQPIGIISVGITTYYKEQTLHKELIITIVSLLLMIGTMFVVIGRVARSVTAPIEKLVQGTEELARGNLELRIPIDTGGEIARLAEKFNGMAESLSLMVRERESAQAALAFSEEKYAKAFKNLSEVVGLVRLSDQKYVEVNELFFESLGYSPEEVIGHSSEDFQLWEDPEDRRRFFKQLQYDKKVRNFECHWQTKNHERRIGNTSSEIITIGGDVYEVFIWNDITEIKKTEEELREVQTKLEIKVEERTSELMALNQELMAMNDELVSTLDRLKKTQQQLLHSEKMAALGSLVAGISHEISTPIGISVTSVSYVEKELSIMAGKLKTGTLRKAELDEYVAETALFLQTTAKNLERADLLIRSFKQISVDQTTEDRRKFKVKPYLEELLLSLNPLLKNTTHRVVIECPENLEVNSYPGIIAQVITNFITNSLRHGFEKDFSGTISIEFDQFGSLYTLTYRDNGKGMTSDVLERIYDPFFTTKRGAEGGTGLGLHLVYNIVTQKLGGEIKCFSEPGKGVSFVITFPDLFED